MATANEVKNGVSGIQSIFDLLSGESRKEFNSKESYDEVEEKNNILDFILDLCSEIESKGEPEKSIFSKIVSWFLPELLRIAVEVLKDKLKEYYLCHSDGDIPTWLLGDGFSIKMDSVDPAGTFKTDPDSLLNILFYSTPFNRFLYYEVLSKPGNTATWPDPLYLSDEPVLTSLSGTNDHIGVIDYKLLDFKYDVLSNDLNIKLNPDFTNVVAATDMNFFNLVALYFESIGKNNTIYKEIQKFKTVKNRTRRNKDNDIAAEESITNPTAQTETNEYDLFRRLDSTRDFIFDPISIFLYFFSIYYGLAARRFSGDRDSIYSEQETLKLVDKMLSVSDTEWCFIDDSFFEFTDSEINELEQITNERYDETFNINLGCGMVSGSFDLEQTIDVVVNIMTCADFEPNSQNIANNTDEEYLYGIQNVGQDCATFIDNEIKYLGSTTLSPSTTSDDTIDGDDAVQLSNNIKRSFIKNLLQAFLSLTIQSPPIRIIVMLLSAISNAGENIGSISNREFLKNNSSFWWDYSKTLQAELRKFLFRELIGKLKKMIPFIIAELLKKKAQKELQILLSLFGCLNKQFDLVKKLNDAV